MSRSLGSAAIALPLVCLWLSEIEQRGAARAFGTSPPVAYKRLDRAAGIDPFAADPYTLKGSVALRTGDLATAKKAFDAALERVPDNVYAELERGAIASAEGDRAQALARLQRAAELAPRDATVRAALDVVRRNERLDLDELNRRILVQAQQLGA